MAATHALILCTSVHHGNTAKVARVMAATLGAEIAAPEEVPFTDLTGVEVVGFGSGIYYGRMHESMFHWLRGLPDVAQPTTPAFVFSTAGLPWLSWFWHRPLRQLLARKGFRVIGEFCCGGHDTWGPLRLTGGLNGRHPDGRDMERASRFAAGIARGLRAPEPAPRCP